MTNRVKERVIHQLTVLYIVCTVRISSTIERYFMNENNRLDQNFVKGHIRAAKCLLCMGESARAHQDLDEAASVEPQNATIEQERNNLRAFEQYEREGKTAYEGKDFRKVICNDTLQPCLFLLRIDK